MLKFLLTLAVIGMVLGLIFSSRGNEGRAAAEGARRGLGCGCMLILILLALGLLAAVFLADASGLLAV